MVCKTLTVKVAAIANIYINSIRVGLPPDYYTEVSEIKVNEGVGVRVALGNSGSAEGTVTVRVTVGATTLAEYSKTIAANTVVSSVPWTGVFTSAGIYDICAEII